MELVEGGWNSAGGWEDIEVPGIVDLYLGKGEATAAQNLYIFGLLV